MRVQYEKLEAATREGWRDPKENAFFRSRDASSRALREPLSRIVWLTETKIRRRYFFIPPPPLGASSPAIQLMGEGGRLNSVRASTDKRQTPSPSFVCFKRHLFGGVGTGCLGRWCLQSDAGERRGERLGEGKGCGRYGVAWPERPHLNATGKGGLNALSSLLCRATYATPWPLVAGNASGMMGP